MWRTRHGHRGICHVPIRLPVMNQKIVANTSNKLEEKWYGFDDELVYKYCWGAPCSPRAKLFHFVLFFLSKWIFFSSSTLIFNLGLEHSCSSFRDDFHTTIFLFRNNWHALFDLCVCVLYYVFPSFPPSLSLVPSKQCRLNTRENLPGALARTKTAAQLSFFKGSFNSNIE